MVVYFNPIRVNTRTKWNKCCTQRVINRGRDSTCLSSLNTYISHFPTLLVIIIYLGTFFPAEYTTGTTINGSLC